MTQSRPSQKGFTLVEILVVCIVFLIIMGILYEVFIVAFQRTNDGRLKVDMQQRAVFALNHWERDIEKTSRKAIKVRPSDPTCVSITPATVLNSYGSVVWDSSFFFWSYDKVRRTLAREVITPNPAGQEATIGKLPFAPTGPEMLVLATKNSNARKILCDNVQDFSLTDSLGNTELQEEPLVLKLKLRRPLSSSQRIGEFTIERRYTLRNNF